MDATKVEEKKKDGEFELQTLREVVKVNGLDVVENFEKNLRRLELKVRESP